MSDTNANRPVFDLFVRFINSGEEDLASEVIATNAVLHAPGSDEPLHGPEGWLRVLRPMRAAFPDIQWEVLETVEEGDTIAARFTTTGTHRSEFMGIQPTGTPVSFTAMNFYRSPTARSSAKSDNPTWCPCSASSDNHRRRLRSEAPERRLPRNSPARMSIPWWPHARPARLFHKRLSHTQS